MLSLRIDNITINIILNKKSQNVSKRDFELLVEYVDAINDIYKET